MGNDTWRYHTRHGAKLFKDASPELLGTLKKEGWVDSPAKLDKEKALDDIPPDLSLPNSNSEIDMPIDSDPIPGLNSVPDGEPIELVGDKPSKGKKKGK